MKLHTLLLILLSGYQLLAESVVTDEQPEAPTPASESIKHLLSEKLTTECSPATLANFELPYLTFDYKNTPLVDIINQIASEKQINVILPQGDLALNQKITFSVPGKVTLTEAWHALNRILEYCGYTWSAENNNHIQLLKVVKNEIQREYLPLYINPPIELLPNSEEVIEAVFYLANLKISDQKVKNTLVNTILMGNAQTPGLLSDTGKVIAIEKQNGILIIDKAHIIQSAMQIIQALDHAGIPDAIEVIPLYYTQAQFVASLFNDKIFQNNQSLPIGFNPVKQPDESDAHFFPKNTRVAPLTRTNAIVIMGTLKGIRTVKDFIIKYIDHPIESGDSILHVYDLQYLNAEDFAGVLDKLVKGGQQSSGQSQGAQKSIGPERDFQGVIIRAEKTSIKSILKGRTATGDTGGSQINPTTADGSQDGSSVAASSEGVETGGNRLIIAAIKKDWRRIKALIKQLDKPQPQVALEVLVVDLTLIGDKALGSQMRNNSDFNDAISKNLNFQTSHLGEPVLTEGDPPTVQVPGGGEIPNFPANALMANLLQFVDNTSNNLANQQQNGSTIISIRDPNNSGIWNIWQILNKTTNATMLAQPFITTLDNQQATITLSQERLLIGGAGSAGGAVTINNVYIPASTSIDILPRISMEHNNINLDIVINVNEFIDNQTTSDGTTPNNTRITRLVQTNANVANNEILAIGGLIRCSETTTLYSTPLLGKVPVFSWFFKRQEKVRQKNNLMVFIAPTIIEPKKGGGVGTYSVHKLCKAQHSVDESVNFQALRDPITRWFFKPDVTYGKNVVQDFVEHKVFDRESGNSSCAMLKSTCSKKPVRTPQEKAVAPVSKMHYAEAEQLKRIAQNEQNPLTRKNGKNQRVLNT